MTEPFQVQTNMQLKVVIVLVFAATLQVVASEPVDTKMKKMDEAARKVFKEIGDELIKDFYW